MGEFGAWREGSRPALLLPSDEPAEMACVRRRAVWAASETALSIAQPTLGPGVWTTKSVPLPVGRGRRPLNDSGAAVKSATTRHSDRLRGIKSRFGGISRLERGVCSESIDNDPLKGDISED